MNVFILTNPEYTNSTVSYKFYNRINLDNAPISKKGILTCEVIGWYGRNATTSLVNGFIWQFPMKLLNKESEFNKLLDDTFNKPLSDFTGIQDPDLESLELLRLSIIVVKPLTNLDTFVEYDNRCCYTYKSYMKPSDKDHFFRKCNGKFFFNSYSTEENVNKDKQNQDQRIRIFKEFAKVVDKYINSIIGNYQYYLENQEILNKMLFYCQEELKNVVRNNINIGIEIHDRFLNIVNSLLEQFRSKKKYELLESKLEKLKEECLFNKNNQDLELNEKLLLQVFSMFKYKFNELGIEPFQDMVQNNPICQSDLYLDIVKDNCWQGYLIILTIFELKIKDNNYEIDFEKYNRIYKDLNHINDFKILDIIIKMDNNISNSLTMDIMLELILTFQNFQNESFPKTISANFLDYSQWGMWEHCFAQIWLTILSKDNGTKTYSNKDIVDCTGDIILTNYLELIRNIIGTSDKFDSLSIYLKTNVVTKNIEKYEEMSTQNANIIFDMIVEDIIEKEEKGMLDFVNQ